MNKLLLTASALVLGMGIASEAWADCNGFYLGARAGIVKHDMDDKNRFMMSGALGYRYNYVRAELEYVWRDKVNQTLVGPDVTAKQNFRTNSYMLNGYIDLAPYHWITPYVGAGIGYSKLKYNSRYIVNDSGATFAGLHHDKNKFTWSVGGGLSVKVTNRFNVDAGYRYYDFGDLKQGDEKTGVKAHEVYGGVRYVF